MFTTQHAGRCGHEKCQKGSFQAIWWAAMYNLSMVCVCVRVCVCVCVCKGVCGMEVEGQHRNFFLTNESVNIGCWFNWETVIALLMKFKKEAILIEHNLSQPWLFLTHTLIFRTFLLFNSSYYNQVGFPGGLAIVNSPAMQKTRVGSPDQ